MNIIPSLTFGDGAEFTFREADMATLDKFAAEEHGVPVAELPIGQAGIILMSGYLSTIRNGALEIYGVVIDSELDGKEALESITDKHLSLGINKQMRKAVMESGRIAVRVFSAEARDSQNTIPVREFQVLSAVRRDVESAFNLPDDEASED